MVFLSEESVADAFGSLEYIDGNALPFKDSPSWILHCRPSAEGLIEVELIKWLVQPGDTIEPGQSLMEVMSDKATMEVPAPFQGTIKEIRHEPGDKIQVGDVILKLEGEVVELEDSDTPLSVANDNAVSQPQPQLSKLQSNGHTSTLPAAAPSVRLLARKMGIDLARVHGSGPAGRILIEDLSSHIKPSKPIEHEDEKPKEAIPFDLGEAGTKIKLLGMRRKIAEQMVFSSQTIPHYSYIDECNLTDLVHLRGQLKETLRKAGVRLTYLPFMVKAAARALKEVPIVNSTFHEKSQEVMQHEEINIGIAVAARDGLIVPVIRDVVNKDIPALATEIDRLSSGARAGKLKVDDLRGGTFTVTSIGGIGGLISTPIINHPEVAIMGVGKVIRRPVYEIHDTIKPADLVYLSFSFDHRIVDGAIGAVFGNAVIRQLENPATLLLPERLSV